MGKYLIILSLLASSQFYGQLTGGFSRGLETPTVAKPETSLGGFSDGEVNLFTGTYGHSIPLGTVSTSGGTSFSLSLNYTSTSVSSRKTTTDNTIPYGEGWSLNIPTIKFNTDTPKQKYPNHIIETKMAEYNNLINTSVFHNSTTFTYCPDELTNEFICAIRSIELDIPGVYSGKMVLKTINSNGELIFVPKNFDKYFELIFKISKNQNNITIDLAAKVILNDGTVYNFHGLDFHYVNPPNILVGGPLMSGSSYHPIVVYDRLRVTQIYNPHINDIESINFKYEAKGIFNEFAQHNQHFFGSYRNAYTSAQEVILKEIYVNGSVSGFTSQRLELNYKLDNYYIDSSRVTFLDDMYIKRVKFSSGENPKPLPTFGPYTSTDWRDWHGYKHPAVAPSNNAHWNHTSTNWLMANPFVAKVGYNYYQYGWKDDPKVNKLNHSYIEKTKIPNDLFIPGRRYEINVKMRGERTKCQKELIDIDLSYSNCPQEHNIGSDTQLSQRYYTPILYPYAKRGKLFTTFFNPYKWYDSKYDVTYSGYGGAAIHHSNTSSNYFIAPDFNDLELGNSCENRNVILRIGPANSDRYMNMPNVASGIIYPNGEQLSTWGVGYKKSGWSYIHPTMKKPGPNTNLSAIIKCFKSCEPCGFNFINPSFGIGVPWDNFTHVYNQQFPGYLFVNGCSDDDYYKNVFHYYPTPYQGFVFQNDPTAIEDVTIEGVQISEIEKLPLMLSDVRLYDYRNAKISYAFDSTDQYNYGQVFKQDSNLVSIKSLVYSLGSLNNCSNLSQYNNPSGYNTSKYHLSYVISRSVNSTDNYAETFRYTLLLSPNYMSSNELTKTNNFNSKFYMLTSVFNSLGIKKKIQYAPNPVFKHLKNDVVQFNFIVNSIIKQPLSTSDSNAQAKETNYVFYEPIDCSKCFDKRKQGYRKVSVLHPIDPVSNTRKSTIYEHYDAPSCSLALLCPSNINDKGLTLGKLKSVEEYSEQGDLLKKTEYEYHLQTAYKSFLRRGYPINSYCAYSDGGGVTNSENQEFSFRFQDFVGRDQHKPIVITFEKDDYSYFVPKKKVTTTDYIKDQNGSTIPSSYTEEYEYYDADTSGKFHSEGQKIVENDPNINQYTIDPSWNIYKKTAYHGLNPNFMTTTEYFYLYQSLNQIPCSQFSTWNTSGYLSSEVAPIIIHKYHLKDLISEIRTSYIHRSDFDEPDTIRKSKYYKYELVYNENYIAPDNDQPFAETINDSTFMKTPCQNISVWQSDSARNKFIYDSLMAYYTVNGCSTVYTPSFRTGLGCVSCKNWKDEKEEDWDINKTYTISKNLKCYRRKFIPAISRWVICPCDLLMPGITSAVLKGNVNFIGVNDLHKLSGFAPAASNTTNNAMSLVGSAGVVAGIYPQDNGLRVTQIPAIDNSTIAKVFDHDRSNDLKQVREGTKSFGIDALDINVVTDGIENPSTRQIAFLEIPSINKLVTINGNLLSDTNYLFNHYGIYSGADFAAINNGYTKLRSRYQDSNIMTIQSLKELYSTEDQIDRILIDLGDEDPPMYYPPEYAMRILFKSEHEKIDDLVVNPDGTWNSNPENRYDIGRFTHFNSLNYHIPFHNITQKTILQRNTFLQTELESDAKGLLTRYYYGTYDLVNVCNSKTCPNVLGQSVSVGKCYRTIRNKAWQLPIRITTGYLRPDSVGINLYYNLDATLAKTVSDQGATIHYTYDGFNRLIETKKDGQILAKYDYKMWNGLWSSTFPSTMDDITNQNYIETKTWAKKGSNQGTISRSFIDPFGRKMGSILGVTSNLMTSSASYTNAVMSGYQELDWEDKPIKQYKPFAVNGGLSLYKNTTYTGAPVEHRQLTYNEKSEPQRTYDYGISSSSNAYSETNTVLIDGQTMATELDLNTLELVLLKWNSSDFYFKTISRDADNKQSISYSYLNGKKLADLIPVSGAGTDITTLYCYDNKWDLKKVIDPEKLETNYWTNLQGLVFEKNTPDQGMSLFFYDESGNLVGMQDKNMWNQSHLRVRVFTYDHFGRMLMQLTGIINAANLCPSCGFDNSYSDDQFYRPRNPMAYQLALHSRKYDITYPTTGNEEIISNNYGRSYHWLPNKNLLNDSINGSYTIFDSMHNIRIEKLFAYNDLKPNYIQTTDMSPNYNTLYLTELNKAKALLPTDITSSISAGQVKSLGKLSMAVSYNSGDLSFSGNEINEITTTTYNTDELPNEEFRYAIFKTYSTQPLKFLTKYSDYDLAGRAGKMEFFKYSGGTNTPLYSTKSEYDLYGRLSQLKFKIGAAAVYTTLADYNYDIASSRLSNVLSYVGTKTLNTTYSYDIRERLTQIDNARFREILYYDNNFPAAGPTVPENYNGNINAVFTEFKGWLVPTHMQPKLTFRYEYDPANRLTYSYANAKLSSSGAIFGTQSFSYMRNGNLTHYVTDTLLPGGMSSAPRNHYYSYLSGTNKLENITSTASATVSSPYAPNNRSFVYDGSGNLRSDVMRDFLNIYYTRANQPRAIQRASNTNAYLHFEYDVADNRIFKLANGNAHYYLSGIGVYNMNNDQWEHYPGGLARIKNGVSTGAADYFNLIVKDHLTNTRAMLYDDYDGSGDIAYTATYDYYPYGKVLRKWENPRSRFQSTDHEKDIETGYDNRGARWWDDERLTPIQPDPHADRYPSLSPYSSFGCNPISIIDRDGKDLIVIGSSNNSEIRRIALTGEDRYYRVNDNAFNTASNGFMRDNMDYNTMLSINSLRRQESEGLGTNLIAEQTGYSVSVSGSMRENNNLIGDVTININADFDDGSRYSTASFDGVAGGFGNGAPENGNYSLSGYQDRSPTGWFNAGMNRDGVGFSYNLNPNFSTGRTDLRFHPDGNNEGTKGCIGLSGDANQLNSFKGRMNKILGSRNSISVDIDILDNPNNNGRRNNRLSNANE